MIRAATIAAIIIAASAGVAGAAELTVADVRGMIASVGINPGTTKDLGPFGVRTVTDLTVEDGRRKGEFVIRLRLSQPRRHNARSD